MICVGSCGVTAASFSVQCPHLNNSSTFINNHKMICEMTPMGWTPMSWWWAPVALVTRQDRWQGPVSTLTHTQYHWRAERGGDQGLYQLSTGYTGHHGIASDTLSVPSTSILITRVCQQCGPL